MVWGFPACKKRLINILQDPICHWDSSRFDIIYHIISYHIISYHIISYIISYHIYILNNMSKYLAQLSLYMIMLWGVVVPKWFPKVRTCDLATRTCFTHSNITRVLILYNMCIEIYNVYICVLFLYSLNDTIYFNSNKECICYININCIHIYIYTYIEI